MATITISRPNQEDEIRDLTAEEEAQRQADITAETARQETEATAVAQEATDKASGNTKLLGLGLTQAEATALTGYTPE